MTFDTSLEQAETAAGDFIGQVLVQPYLHKDWEGYVFWKGQHVEHFSFRDSAEEFRAAQQLVERCEALENAGLPVNARTALMEDCFQAPSDSPWKDALPHYYAFFEGDGVYTGIFYRAMNGDMPGTVFSIEAKDGAVFVTEQPGCVEAYHAFQRAGLRGIEVSTSYATTEKNLERLGVNPAQLALEIKGKRSA